jgi:putative phosphoesterase
MKVGIVSDVHNNAEALRYALEQLRGCELVLSLGDLVSQYRATPEIIALAREAELLTIVGNHEKTILAPCGQPIRSKMAPDDLAFFQEQPTQRRLEVDGRRVLVTHGSPWDDPESIGCIYIYEQDRESLKRMQALDADVILMGHTHVAMGLRQADTTILNPGSTGEARDRQRRLSYGLLDFDAGQAAVYQIQQGLDPELIVQVDC